MGIEPTPWEWSFIYLPILVILIFAWVGEWFTDRVPNWPSLCVCGYLLTMRLTHEPEVIGSFLISFLIGFVLIVGVGWGSGVLGGGTAKIGAAICLGLPWRLALGVSLATLLLILILYATRSLHRAEKIHGMFVLTIAYGIPMAAVLLTGNGA